VDNFLIRSRAERYLLNNVEFMLIKDEVLTLLEVRHNEGTSKKTGKPYSIYSFTLGDDDYNRLAMDIGRDLLVEGVTPDWIFKVAEKKDKVICDIEIVPDGFGTKCRVVGMRPFED